MNISDAMLAKRDRDSFDGGFEAGKDYAAEQIAALVKALTEVRDEFDARYDGAPDSRVLWMGPLMRDIDIALALGQSEAKAGQGK